MIEHQSRWVRVKDMRDAEPLNTRKLYQLKHKRTHENLFAKLGGCLFVDLARLDRLLDDLRCGKPEK